MITNFTSLSRAYSSFATNFGEAFIIDQMVYEKYFRKSVENLKAYPYFNGYNSFGQKLDIELGLVMNKKHPNAYCAFHEEKHFIIMEHLFPIALMEFFQKLLANPAVLPDLGNTKLDTMLTRLNQGTMLPGFEIISGSRPIKNLDEIEQIFGALCPERRRAASLLYEHAMTFLYSHEVCHAFMGHVIFANKRFGISDLNETCRERHLNSFSKISCHLEMQADRGAAWNTVGLPMSNLNDKRPFDDKVLDASFRILGSSLLLYFFALTDLNFSKLDQESIYKWFDHPSSAARAIGMSIIPVTQLPDYNPELESIMLAAGTTVRRELYRMANAIAYMRPYNWLRNKDLSGLLSSENELSSKQKKQINKELKPYSFLRKTAPK